LVVGLAGALHLFDKKNLSIALGVDPVAADIFSNCRFVRRSIE
jgi:hypothetical protein